MNPNKRTIEATELYKPVVKKFKKRNIITLGIDNLWAADLLIMTKFAKENTGYKYILNVIDTFSKYVWAQPLKKKDAASVCCAFEKIIKCARKNNHQSCDLLHVDKGREFVNSKFKSLLSKYDIKMYHTENEEKSAIVERFNRTLNEKLKFHFHVNDNFRWTNILQPILDTYNNTFHHTIRIAPSQVNKSNEKEVLEKYYKKTAQHIRADFCIGDRVRITKLKKVFANKYSTNWTREIFLIDKIVYSDPVTYKLRDLRGEPIIGSFYKNELLKTQL